MYKAIFLDIDNTLLSFTAAAQDSMRTAMAQPTTKRCVRKANYPPKVMKIYT